MSWLARYLVESEIDPKKVTFVQWLKTFRNKKEVIDSRSPPGTLRLLRSATD
jgi:hypothetical protein